jgi:hypothetical protein
MIIIDELTIRIPDYSPEKARHMGAEVAKRIAEAVPGTGNSLSIKSMHVSLSLNGNMQDVEMAEIISKKIIDQLKLVMR